MIPSTNFATPEKLVSITSRMRSTRSLCAATSSRSSRIGSCRGRPLTADMIAGKVAAACPAPSPCRCRRRTDRPDRAGDRAACGRPRRPRGAAGSPRSPSRTACCRARRRRRTACPPVARPRGCDCGSTGSGRSRSAFGTHFANALKLTGGNTPGKHEVARPANARAPLFFGWNWSRVPGPYVNVSACRCRWSCTRRGSSIAICRS